MSVSDPINRETGCMHNAPSAINSILRRNGSNIGQTDIVIDTEGERGGPSLVRSSCNIR